MWVIPNFWPAVYININCCCAYFVKRCVEVLFIQVISPMKPLFTVHVEQQRGFRHSTLHQWVATVPTPISCTKFSVNHGAFCFIELPKKVTNSVCAGHLSRMFPAPGLRCLDRLQAPVTLQKTSGFGEWVDEVLFHFWET